ncbi:hypothetical protein VAEU17_3920001 [Vibrio aestuarianus]|nr:hypothetical protein VAEU17_3920001 [Vibrio aestuarianus]
MSIVYNSTLDQSYFELEGGYIASQSTMSLQDVITRCYFEQLLF